MGQGDYIGLFNPGFPSARTESQMSHSDTVFEYHDDTVLFHMSEKDARQAGVNKVEVDMSDDDDLEDLSTALSSRKLKNGIMERDEEVILLFFFFFFFFVKKESLEKTLIFLWGKNDYRDLWTV